MSPAQFMDDDEGKRVVSADGEAVGIITEVRRGTAYVDPDPGVYETLKSKLNWAEADEDTYPLSADQAEEVTGDEVRLQ